MTNNQLDILCLLDITFVNTYTAISTDYPMHNKGRYRHGFLYTICGTETYHFSDKTILAVPDSVMYIPEGEPYTITFQGENSIVITLDFELNSNDIQRPFSICMAKNNQIKSCFYDTEKIWNRKQVGDKALCKCNFYKIISLLLKHDSHYTTSTHYERIRDSVNYLHAHYLENSFKIEKLFQIANISPKYFETLFTQEFNMTPKAYVGLLKIERAKELLMNEKYSVGDIATQLGYTDIYHFSKTFKQKTGYTPTEYRRI